MGLQTPPGSFFVTSSRKADRGTLAEWTSFQRRLTITMKSEWFGWAFGNALDMASNLRCGHGKGTPKSISGQGYETHERRRKTAGFLWLLVQWMKSGAIDVDSDEEGGRGVDGST